MAEVKLNFYLCPQPGCRRKYKTERKLAAHVKQHGLSSPAPSNPVETGQKNDKQEVKQSFYLCPQPECNRKYKTERSWVMHVKQHGVENPALPDPVEIEKKQKVRSNAKLRPLDDTVAKARKQRQLEDEAKREADEKLKEKYGEEYTQIQEETLRIQKRVRENPNDCCICSDVPADSAVSPCGHAYFCYPCLANCQINYKSRGCPFCRGPIVKAIKIYQ